MVCTRNVTVFFWREKHGHKSKKERFGLCIVINNTHRHTRAITHLQREKKESEQEILVLVDDAIDIIKYFTDSHNIFICHLKVVQAICV